jgi:hypothetical protein
MLGNVLDRAVRPVARALDANYMQRLGIATTMRLAYGYNKFKYARHQRFRVDQAHRLGRLLPQIASPSPPAVRMHDGYAIDTSQSLPFLAELIEAGERIIAKRGRQPLDCRDKRPFIRNIIKHEDVVRHRAILDFATSPRLLRTLVDYQGFVPRLSRDLPPGVRLTESAREFDPTPDAPFRESQLFHLDIHDHALVYVIVAIRDIGTQDGPFSFLPRSASERAAAALNYRRRGGPYRLADEVVYQVADRKELIEFCYPKGSVCFVDSARCFHYGSRSAIVPRYQFMFAYVSACRTDFAEVYMRPQIYPVAPTDPPLRQMVLNQHYLA